MQLVVDVRIPELFGGVEGEAIFIGKVCCLYCVQNSPQLRLISVVVLEISE